LSECRISRKKEMGDGHRSGRTGKIKGELSHLSEGVRWKAQEKSLLMVLPSGKRSRPGEGRAGDVGGHLERGEVSESVLSN